MKPPYKLPGTVPRRSGARRSLPNRSAHGLRKVSQKASGFAATTSKTVAVFVEELSRRWTEAALRRKWLLAPGITVRKSTPGKSIRLTCSDGSRVNATLFAKGEHKAQVTIDHDKLPDAAPVTRARAEWKAALARLEGLTAGPGKAPRAPTTSQATCRSRLPRTWCVSDILSPEMFP
ncbi:MAG: hypothetical protein J0L64_13520 [Acidobacteria bacterium]|nr:hypothetical protein [Acidobacteriota bacterium]